MAVLDQAHFRFRADGGAVDATPTWDAAEDANVVKSDATPFRLRVAVQNIDTVDAPAGSYQLYMSKNGGAYALVTTSSTNGLKAVDASTSPDETQVLIPRLSWATADGNNSPGTLIAGV